MKIKLPRAVGEELDDYLRKFNKKIATDDPHEMYSFDGFIVSALMGGSAVNTRKYLSCDLTSKYNQRVVNLLYAWLDEWEEE